MGLTREQIVAAKRERRPVPVEVEGWGGTVYVRVMSAEENLALTQGETTQADLIYGLLLDSLVTEEGARLFTAEDREFLAGEPFPVILQLFKEAAKINGLPTEQLEEAMENFEPTPTPASSTASP